MTTESKPPHCDVYVYDASYDHILIYMHFIGHNDQTHRYTVCIKYQEFFLPARISMLILLRSGKSRHLRWVVLAGGALWSQFSQPLLQEVLFVPTLPGALLETGIKTRDPTRCAPPNAHSQQPLWPPWPWASAIKEVIYTASFFCPTKCSVRLDSRLARGRRLACFTSIYLSVFPFMKVYTLTLTWLLSMSYQTNIRYTFV